jgi:hypothetical protein
VSSPPFPHEYSLVFLVAVITLGPRTVEGAVQAGMGYSIGLFALTYLPTRFQGIQPILFAFGSVTYAAHPEGILEYQKTRWLRRVNRLFVAYDQRRGRVVEAPVGTMPGMGATLEAVPSATVSSGEGVGV